MPSLDSSASVSGDVIYRELAGEMVLLDLASGTYFGLNEVGARTWHLIVEHGSLRRVFEILHDEYDVAPETLENDLRALVDELAARGLISVQP